jgi:acyl-homoserine-lactone acylase
VLTYSQSSDPASPHYADLTALYSSKGWNALPFCTDAIEAATISTLDVNNAAR